MSFSAGNSTKTDALTYSHETTPWVLGVLHSVESFGVYELFVTLDGNNVPTEIDRFGRRIQSLSYNDDGTIQDLTPTGIMTLQDVLEQNDPASFLERASKAKASPSVSLANVILCAPVEGQERRRLVHVSLPRGWGGACGGRRSAAAARACGRGRGP